MDAILDDFCSTYVGISTALAVQNIERADSKTGGGIVWNRNPYGR